jgi:hypothetical protein
MVGADASRDLKVVADTRARTPLLMQDAAALQLLACVRASRALGGALAEAGVYRGGSARLICEAKGDRPLHLFDVFETLQASGVELPAGSAAREVRDHFGTVHASQAAVAKLLAGYVSVHIHAGILPDSAAAVANERFAFVHLDLDLARGTCDALEFFRPRMLPGGIIVGDDYESAAVKGAFAEHFDGRSDTIIELPWSQVIVVVGG